MRAGAFLLGGDDRPQRPVDRVIQRFDGRVVVVQAGAVDADDQLRAGTIERVALQLLKVVAVHLAVEVSGAGMALVGGIGGLVRGAARADHQPPKTSRARGARRQRPRRPSHNDPGGDLAGHLDLAIKQHRTLGVRLRGGKADHLKLTGGKRQPQLPGGVLKHRAQLHQLRHQRSQAPVGRQALLSQRHRHHAPRRDLGRGLVGDVQERVGVIAGRRKEPRLNPPAVSHAFDAPGALGQPHVPQAPAEQAPLLAAVVLGQLPQRPQPAVYRGGVDADPVI